MTIALKRPRRDPTLGAVYTPEPIVRFMLRACLSATFVERMCDDDAPLRILDPSCGDGAYLLEAFNELRRLNPEGSPIEVISRHLFGVDIDPVAVKDVHERLRQVIQPTDSDLYHPSKTWQSNFVQGDALTGPDFHQASVKRCDSPSEGLDWQATFPQVAAAGGFDLIIGNPPYVREKNAKPLFDRLAHSELGRRHRQPRMDLWHYFLHRGLDLLRPGGILCFIVNSYWTSAVSARPLIDRLAAETTLRQLVLFGDSPLFDGVTGRHMVLQLQKGTTNDECRIIDLTRCDDGLTELSTLINTTSPPDDSSGQIVETFRSQASLFDRGRLQINPVHRKSRLDSTIRLGDVCTVRQGIAENPPFVTRKMAAELKDCFHVGEGVFVLTQQEVDLLGLSGEEQSLLRPYYLTRSIGRYSLPTEPTHRILYLTPRTAPDVTSLPAIARHLEQVRPVLERRREVMRGTIQWWHLHWPREEQLFREPRVLAVQMGRHPQFVYAESPTYVGFSVNVVRLKEAHRLSLPALTAVLNSAWAADWFNGHAKRRGVALDISGTVLRDCPLPSLSPQIADRLHELCLARQSASEQEHQKMEHEIDRLIDRRKPHDDRP
ncbi:MAG: Eco57I restriction-modification methylase domain-containing protein [Planctomycetaceae bacterium]|nr:Eco57I restriction-modification methylase domain-containing protein [Planctomycetaceae bacterium]